MACVYVLTCAVVASLCAMIAYAGTRSVLVTIIVLLGMTFGLYFYGMHTIPSSWWDD